VSSASAANAGTVEPLRQIYDALPQLVVAGNSFTQAIERISAGVDHFCSKIGDLASGPLQKSIGEIKTDLVALRQHHDIIEPFAHVEAVEQLRQQNRPERVKLLLLAESHVRVPDDQFNQRGCGFIYEPRYTTPWWYDLFLPGFGSNHDGRLTPELKVGMLSRMRDAGFWVLDASVLSLSGYAKVGCPENRPFSKAPYRRGHERELLNLSWQVYVQPIFCALMSVPNPPVLAAYRRVSHLLPSQWRSNAEPFLVFPPRNHQAHYRQSTFVGGTQTFRRKAADAGFGICLRAD